MQTSDNMFTAHDVHFHDTPAATRGRSNHYFSFATWPMGVGTPRCAASEVARVPTILSKDISNSERTMDQSGRLN